MIGSDNARYRTQPALRLHDARVAVNSQPLSTRAGRMITTATRMMPRLTPNVDLKDMSPPISPQGRAFTLQGTCDES